MSNNGILGGARRSGYQDHDVQIRGFITSGTPTQPTLGNSTKVARWVRKPNGLIHYYGQITFGSGATFGSGETVWGLSLPVPGNRASGAADQPIGTGFAWQGTSASPSVNVAMVATMMDPLAGGGGAQTQEDSWAQFFCPYLLSWGTGSIGTGSTSTNVTHNLGHTPNAYDIHFTPTTSTGNNTGTPYVSATSSTTFTVTLRTAPTGTGLDFSWKARAEPNGSTALDLLAARNKPWTWAAGHVFGWNLTYEARR
jgi:hypothetical protein